MSGDERLTRITEAHSKEVDEHGGTWGLCGECAIPWPCPTYRWATDDTADINCTWDLSDCEFPEHNRHVEDETEWEPGQEVAQLRHNLMATDEWNATLSRELGEVRAEAVSLRAANDRLRAMLDDANEDGFGWKPQAEVLRARLAAVEALCDAAEAAQTGSWGKAVSTNALRAALSAAAADPTTAEDET